jgi:Lon protease-like protein
VTEAAAPLPLFPLQTVLFPGGLLNLKVFEARYLDLITRCLRERLAFGVVCLRQGHEVGRDGVRLESIGALAHIQEVDADQTGILQVRCLGGERFEFVDEPVQDDAGLWQAETTPIDADPIEVPAPAMLATVKALAQAIQALKAQGALPIAEPFRLDDAGWVANRWCELLPISLAAKQKLMALPSPSSRLALVDEYLRGKGVVG